MFSRLSTAALMGAYILTLAITFPASAQEYSDVYDQIEFDRNYTWCLEHTRGTEAECYRWAIKTTDETLTEER